MSSQRDDKVQLMYWRGEALVPGSAALPPTGVARALSQTSWRSWGNLQDKPVGRTATPCARFTTGVHYEDGGQPRIVL
jgi:hypothetical protein